MPAACVLLPELSGILTCWLDILALANNSAQFFCAELPATLHGKKYMEVRRCAAPVAQRASCHAWTDLEAGSLANGIGLQGRA